MFKNAVHLFEIFGFRIKVDPSWLLIAGLLVWSLSSSYFPQQLPGYSRYDYVALATVAMLGLFASLILHELSHSLVARQFGLQVGGITLFIFGGVAELEHEPQNPKSEFWIAVAGPMMSFALSAVSFGLSAMLRNSGVSQSLATIFNYLGTINFLLAAFNLVPAFPLDGGRVLRAALWHLRGDLLGATRIASRMGTVFAFVLIGLGLLSLFSYGGIAGVWQILIGVFLLTISASSYRQMEVSAALKDMTVWTLMARNPVTADPRDTVETLVNGIMLTRNVSFVPVTEGDHLIGYVNSALVHGLDRENWPQTRLADILVATSDDNTVSPDVSTQEVFDKMVKSNQRKLLVAEAGRLVGVISLADLMNYLAIRNELSEPLATARRASSKQEKAGRR